jgi:hypothetical protein
MQHEGGRARPEAPAASAVQAESASAPLLAAVKDLDQRWQALNELLALELRDVAEQRDALVARGLSMLAKIDSQAEQLKELGLQVGARKESLKEQLRENEERLRENEERLRGSGVSSAADAARRKQEATEAYDEQAGKLLNLQREFEKQSQARLTSAKQARGLQETKDLCQTSLDELRRNSDGDRSAAALTLVLLRAIKAELVGMRERLGALRADALAQWATGIPQRLGSCVSADLLGHFSRIESERQTRLLAQDARKRLADDLNEAQAALAQARLSEGQAAAVREAARRRKDAALAEAEALSKKKVELQQRIAQLGQQTQTWNEELGERIVAAVQEMQVLTTAARVAAEVAMEPSTAFDDAEDRFRAAANTRAAREATVTRLASEMQPPRAVTVTPAAAAAAAAAAGDAIVRGLGAGGSSSSSSSGSGGGSSSSSSSSSNSDDDPFLTSFLPRVLAQSKRDAVAEEDEDDAEEALSARLKRKSLHDAAALAKRPAARPAPTKRKEGIDDNWDYYSLDGAERKTCEATAVDQTVKLAIQKSKIATETITYLVFALHKKPSPAYHIL